MLTSETIRPILVHQCHVPDGASILVAVSGGADSMALLHLLKAMTYRLVVAHCNFHLRDEESDGDQALVERFCTDHQIECHTRDFDTIGFANQHGISIEMAARDLRYEWFWELAHEQGCDYLATAHHANDNIETFMLNLARGTGVRGLTGMAFESNKLIRPLLQVTRQEIETYCQQHQIEWRHDSSNNSIEFTRNRIRHQIIPEFHQINPSFATAMQHTMARMQELESLLIEQVEAFKREWVADDGQMQLIPIRSIANHSQKGLILFELLRDKGFNSSQVANILDCLDGLPGKQFLSSTYRVVRDRHNLIVTPLPNFSDDQLFTVNVDDVEIPSPFRASFKLFDRPDYFQFSTHPFCVHFDADKIDFPLTIRHWQQGDVLMPLGMNHLKKVSDFFIDEKMSVPEKENIWLMLSGDAIMWIVGKRTDDRFKITTRTKVVLEIKIEEPTLQ